MGGETLRDARGVESGRGELKGLLGELESDQGERKGEEIAIGESVDPQQGLAPADAPGTDGGHEGADCEGSEDEIGEAKGLWNQVVG